MLIVNSVKLKRCNVDVRCLRHVQLKIEAYILVLIAGLPVDDVQDCDVSRGSLKTRRSVAGSGRAPGSSSNWYANMIKTFQQSSYAILKVKSPLVSVARSSGGDEDWSLVPRSSSQVE